MQYPPAARPRSASTSRTGADTVATLQARNAELESIFAAAPVGIAVLDRGSRFLLVNAELARMHGIDLADHVGRSVRDVVPALAEGIEQTVAQVFATGETLRGLEFSGDLPSQPGLVRHWLSGFYPVRSAAGRIRAVGVWVTEITEHKQAQAALEASRLKLSIGIQAAGLVMAEIDYRSNQNHLSAELARLLELGDGPMTVTRQAVFDRIHPEDRPRYLEEIARTTNPAGDGHLAIDVRLLLPSGAVRWLHIRLQVTFSMVDGELRADRGICAARDATAEIVAGHRLRAAQRLTASIIESAGALVFAKDLQGRYILSNQSWRDAVGLSPEQAEGVTDDALFGPEVAATLRSSDAQVARTGAPLRVEEHGLMRGRPVTYRTNKFPLYDEAGHIFAVCGVSTDITDVVEADRRKDEFIATLAHELRNPLAPIRNGLHLLQHGGELSPSGERVRSVMERQLTHLVRLVDDLLDVSRISGGKVELRPEPVTLQRVFEHAVEACQPALDAAGHTLLVTLPPEALWVRADLVRIAQVVSNLLNNAAKYTPPGGRIELRARGDTGCAVIEVCDNGAGIAPEMAARVFELFAQVEGTVNRAQGGLGIGLWLVKKLVELHQGSVRVDSPGLGRGCTFTVRLPLLG
ncbi:PAS domain-containing protein [Ramlibacter sp. AN1015]|uniref:PAS domain-containing sensor histidine kinase n=1 Tax=Ramlibacter sp. AN1015 TaxID=3133428 RepID=UPI0030BB4CE5